MAKRLIVTERGDTDVFETEEYHIDEVGENEFQVQTKAIGLNFAQLEKRSGRYDHKYNVPYSPGMEGAGVVSEVGENVEQFEVGDPVMWLTRVGSAQQYIKFNSNTNSHVMNGREIASTITKIPDGMSMEIASTFLLQNTAAYLALFEYADISIKDDVLIHAVAGGFGTAAVQMANGIGATTYGTSSKDWKLEYAVDNGLDYPINYEKEDFSKRINEMTDDGVYAVLEGVGGKTFKKSIECLQPYGTLVTYGAASGTPGFTDSSKLIYSNKCIMGLHIKGIWMHSDKCPFGPPTDKIVTLWKRGVIDVNLSETFDISNISEAHDYMANRMTTGSVSIKLDSYY